MAKHTCKSRSIPQAPAHARAILEIDLVAIRQNWRKLNNIAAGSVCAAVVKANAYGLGLEEIVTAVVSEGCNTFFVATLEEGRRTRLVSPSSDIYVLDGLLAGAEAHYSGFNLRPVLSSTEEITDWACFCKLSGRRLPAALQIDTGMRRLGVPLDEFVQMVHIDGPLSTFDPVLLMSHLACADTPQDKNNMLQLKRFEEARSIIPGVPCSLANSGGIFLGPEFHLDVVRPGIALYGGRAFEGEHNPMATVVKLYARILQIQFAKAGETVGYGATHTLKRPSRIATISMGYADGFLRSLGGDETGPGALGFINDHKVPIIGRISMDLMTLDVTNVPEHLAQRGGWIEVMGDRVTVDDLTDQIGTIGYELLSRLSRRVHRVYLTDH